MAEHVSMRCDRMRRSLVFEGGARPYLDSKPWRGKLLFLLQQSASDSSSLLRLSFSSCSESRVSGLLACSLEQSSVASVEERRSRPASSTRSSPSWKAVLYPQLLPPPSPFEAALFLASCCASRSSGRPRHCCPRSRPPWRFVSWWSSATCHTALRSWPPSFSLQPAPPIPCGACQLPCRGVPQAPQGSFSHTCCAACPSA
mmetsp:Transcript_20/g.77  ORF Transcript_20/g.77 Transcript_20/m.77 type:complete len:201 (+) Transcript_20:672-1274(+)